MLKLIQNRYLRKEVKYKTTKTLDQISMLTANIRTAFATAVSYEGLTTANARAWGFASNDMYGSASGTLMNPFLGGIKVGAAAGNGIKNMGFFVEYSNIPKDVCVQLAVSDWGVSGFTGLAKTATEGGEGAPSADYKVDSNTGKITFVKAAELCKGASDTNTSITMYFY